MQYYKIIYDNKIIGVVSSKSFIQYIPIANCFERCSSKEGEYVSYSGQLYRDSWMNPTQINESFIEARIVEITKEEYDVFIEVFNTDPETEIEEEEEQEPIIIPQPIDPIDEITIDFIRTYKTREMSTACRLMIETGFDLVIRGKTAHFSLTTQDQLNLMSLGTMIQTQELIPYHADGEECEFYTPEEITQIIDAAASFKNYQLAYYNALKTYINALDNIEDINAITYGTPIPDEYKSDVLRVLE